MLGFWGFGALFPTTSQPHNPPPVLMLPTQLFIRKSQQRMLLSNEQLYAILLSYGCERMHETASL